MGISRSNEDGGWTATVSMFSGRRDPSWRVPLAVAQRLLEVWNDLQPSDEETASSPPLGYRGCLLQSPDDQQWHAYGGAITQFGHRGLVTRIDPDRTFERLLLESAPEGTLRPGMKPLD